MRDEVADEQLMELYRDGDAGAFDVLYHRHKGGLYRYLFRLCKQKSVAEELFQDVWSNIIRSRERYQPSAKFSTFLYQVAHNRLIDYIRQTPETTLSLDAGDEDTDCPAQIIPADPGGQPEILVERKRLIESLVENIEALPALQREAFLLREEAGLSLEEIALATGVTAGNSQEPIALRGCQIAGWIERSAMSQDREFETYLQGKTDLSQLYADLPQVELPDHLDAAILAEAHRAVKSRPAAKPRRRWSIPLSMVASLFVVVMIGLQLPYMLKDAALPQPQEEERIAVAAMDKSMSEPRPLRRMNARENQPRQNQNPNARVASQHRWQPQRKRPPSQNAPVLAAPEEP